jgi:ribose 5-phosphate isomerase B
MSAKLRLVVGSDDAGFEYKEALKADLEASELVESVQDVGVDATSHTPYPSVAIAAADSSPPARPTAPCWSAARASALRSPRTRSPGVRAVTAHDSFSVERSILSNNAQVLTFGQRVVGLELARRLAKEWLTYTFDESSASAEKVTLIKDYEGVTSC